MRIPKLRGVITACVACSLVFFVLGFLASRSAFVRVVTVSPDQKSQSSVIKFDIPQVPLPSDWAAKENLPGNSFSTAFLLNPGIDTQGTINDSNAIDYFSFSIKDPSQIVIDITNVPKSLYWIVYDSAYKQVAASYRTGSTSGSSHVLLQNAGTYYIKVWADYHDYANYPYNIRLSILPYFE